MSAARFRYLFNSNHGYLGAIGFAASALYLEPRDQCLGWSTEQRTQYLPRVVEMNRFLIRPAVHCRNLASHLLARSLKRLPKDSK